MFLICFYFESSLHPIPEHLAGENSNSKRQICVYVCVCVCVCMRARAHVCCFSRVWLFATLWTVANQAPLSVWFSRQEYWSRLPRPPPEGIPDPGVEPLSPASPALHADSLPLSLWGSPCTYMGCLNVWMYIHPCLSESLCCTPETDTTLCVSYSSTGNKGSGFYYVWLYHSEPEFF